jgi:lipid II:glycine glycyltransferase (peptidoglycan interpeptide bridge formation enzyme)
MFPWETFLDTHPNSHILQTPAWGELKSAFGWQAEQVMCERAGAQILFRSLPLGLTFAYIPRGPVGYGWDELWPMVDVICRQHNAIFLKVEPDIWDTSSTGWPPAAGFSSTPHTIQPPRTVVIDLHGDEKAILGRMKQKTRYNIGLAQKKGVTVRPSNDLAAFQRLMELTGQRDAFGVHSLAYYQKAYELFQPRCACELLLAEYEGEPLGAVLIFCRGERAWYFYGGSSNEHRDRMPNYLLQWEAIRWAKNQGCTEYDLWGVPDADEATLEAQFSERSDGLWGVYRFKRGFGGELRRSVGPWERVYNPLLYRFYRWWIGRRQTG